MTRTTGPVPFHPGTPWEMFRFELPEMGAPAVAELSEPAEPLEAAPEPPSWAGPSREEWEGLQQQNAALLSWAQQRAEAEAAQAQERATFDPFNEDPDTLLRQIIREEIAPIAQAHEEMDLAAGQELAYDVIADNVAREGDFLHEGSQERAFQLARAYLPNAIQRFGYTDKAGEQALEMACKAVREWESQVGKAYHERQMNQLASLSGAPREPGVGGAATQIQAGPYSQGQRVTDRFFGGGSR